MCAIAISRSWKAPTTSRSRQERARFRGACWASSDQDADLLTNPLVWLLEKPSKVQDTTWIKPGKVAWDWWNDNNVYGVDFKAGVNTQTYKYYIDFAAKYGIPYIILDEGWYKLGNVLDVVPEINMEELTAYAKQKNVGIILWVVWKTLDDQLIPALDQYQKWGIKGIKVDFMQRSDQLLINYYHKVSRETAKRKMLVDFHGDQKPATMTRTWPNLISTEGVRGMEWSKWSAEAEPEHNVTLPFTRMFLGPMDYTPGAMLNATKTSFAPIIAPPDGVWARAAINWRCTWCTKARCRCFPTARRTTCANRKRWNSLRRCRRSGTNRRRWTGKSRSTWPWRAEMDRDWYVGAMNNWSARELEIDFSFLPEGHFQMNAYQDGENADRIGKRLQTGEDAGQLGRRN